MNLKRILVYFVVMVIFVFALLRPSRGELERVSPRKLLGKHDVDHNSCAHFDVHSNIYEIGLQLHCVDYNVEFTVGLLVAIFFTVVLEIATHKLEQDIHNEVTKELINRVYYELMVMGMISFLVQFIESTSVFEKIFSAFEKDDSPDYLYDLTHRRILIFELVHICLFVLSVYYVLTVVLCYCFVKFTWYWWKKVEQEDEAKSVRNARLFCAKYESQFFFWKLVRVKQWYHYRNAVDKLNYWATRSRFIAMNNLKKDFRYFVYLKYRVRRLLVELSRLSFFVWGFIFILALINLAHLEIRKNFPQESKPSVLVVPIFIGTFGGGSCLFVLILVLWIRLAFNNYLTNTSQNFNRNQAALMGKVDLMESLVDEEKDQPEPSTANSKNHFPIEKYFILKSPKLFFLFIQTSLFFQCFYLSLYTCHFLYIIIGTDQISKNIPVRIIFGIMGYSISGIIYFFLSLVLSPFTILTSQENYSSVKAIEYTLSFMKQYPFGKPKRRMRLNRVAGRHDSYFDNHHDKGQEYIQKFVQHRKTIIAENRRSRRNSIDSLQSGPGVFASLEERALAEQILHPSLLQRSTMRSTHGNGQLSIRSSPLTGASQDDLMESESPNETLIDVSDHV